MLIDYIANFGKALELCEEFERRVTSVFFRDGTVDNTNRDLADDVFYYELILPLKACFNLYCIFCPHHLGEYEPFAIEQMQRLAKPEIPVKLQGIVNNLKTLKTAFGSARKEMEEISTSFDTEEKLRMNEAIHNYFEGCTNSCIAMAASTVESRLLKLMSRANPEVVSELENKTFGLLISEYTQHKKVYKSIVPKRHESLLELCNEYRIFSVHPKRKVIRKTILNSIFNLSLEFLTDTETNPERVKVE